MRQSLTFLRTFLGDDNLLGNRSLKQVFKAATERPHYIALFNMFWVYPDVVDGLTRYLMGSGQYPCTVGLRTPVGTIHPRLFNSHDILTVNEIFCRKDYWADESLGTVVDLGSNIGISALYFLTRNKVSKCYLFEPDARNSTKLRENLAGFEDRYSLQEIAVSHESGELEFGIEDTGRYGGIGRKTGQSITVKCENVNEAIGQILEHEKFIDILKIDTEGVEVKTVLALEEKIAKRIKMIYLEASPKVRLHADIFEQKQYGSVCQLKNKFF